MNRYRMRELARFGNRPSTAVTIFTLLSRAKQLVVIELFAYWMRL